MSEKKLFTAALRIIGLILFLIAFGNLFVTIISTLSMPAMYRGASMLLTILIAPMFIGIIGYLFMFRPAIFANWLKLNEEEIDTKNLSIENTFRVAIFSVGLYFSVISIPQILNILVDSFSYTVQPDIMTSKPINMFNSHNIILSGGKLLMSILFITSNKQIASWVIKKNK